MMSRMDKYEESNETSEVISRQAKNQDMYKDVYLNNTFVDYGELKEAINKKETVVEEEIVTVIYEEKNYNVNDYLKKAHENKISDNVMRSLDNTDCEVNKVKDKEDEISKLIDSIEKKEKESDFFSELLPDDENTIITDPVPEEKLDNVIDDEALYNYAMANPNIEEKEFQDILEEKSLSKKNKLPLIIFFITLFLLVAVIVIILVLK